MARPFQVSFVLVASCLRLTFVCGSVHAQHITIDGRLSPAQTLVGPNYTVGANLGKQVGSNLFQSFGLFGLTSGETATFTGPATISNVIGRVTGGSPSSINGGIQSTITGAKLYLINPSGVVFGPNATVNVSGSFHASTADYLKMSDGAKFQATNPAASTLSAAPPAAFGFLTASPAQISVNGGTLGPVPGTLDLVGGPVSISGGTLSAPAGTIHVTSAAGTGEVPVDAGNKSALTVTTFGPVSISGNSTLDVSNPNGVGSGGSVFIRSGALTIEASTINADNYGSGTGGGVTIGVDRDIILSSGAQVHSFVNGLGNGGSVEVTAGEALTLTGPNTRITTTVQPTATGAAGAVTVTAQQIEITGGAEIASKTAGPGGGGILTVTATAGALVLDGQNTGGPITGIVASATMPQSGPAGRIMISAGTLTIECGAQIASTNAGTGNGGTIDITATGDVNLSGTGPSGASGINVSSSSTGPAGNLTLTAGGVVALSGGAQIASFVGGPDHGGSVQVTAGEALTLTDPSTRITATATSAMSGNAGSVTVSAPQIAITAGAEIASKTAGPGAGGTLKVTAGALLLDGENSANEGQITGIVASATRPQSGPAGQITVSAGNLTIEGGAQIASTNAGTFNGGDIDVAAIGSVNLSGTGPDGASGIVASTTSSGPAGQITVSAGTLTIEDGAQIASTTAGTGNGGSVQVAAQAPLSLSDPGSGIIASATSTASGNAGSVAVSAQQITVTSGAEIASTTAGSGAGGSVGVTTPGALVLDGTGLSSTQIAASAIGAQSGPGGAVTVQAGSLTVQNGAQIASTAAGLGNGGNVGVTIAGDASLSGAANGTASGVSAAATQGAVGGAGQVTLVAGGALSVSGGAEINSSTAGRGNGGTVTVSSQGPLSLSGGGGIAALATQTASGNGGSVTVNAPQITVTSGSEIASTTAGTGAGGAVGVTTPGALVLDGQSVAIAASATGVQSGAGGSVNVAANALTVEGGAQIASAAAGLGNGGSVSVNIAGPVVINGNGVTGITGITSQSLAGIGNGGDVRVSGYSLSVLNGGMMASGTHGSGNGGSVFVDASQAISIDGGQITALSGGGSGSGGNVTVASANLTLHSGGEISTETFGPGSGGNIFVTVSGNLAIDTSTGTSPSGILATAAAGSTGTGGNVTLSAGNLTLVSGGVISTERLGSGHTGSISVSVSQDLSIDGSSGTGITGITSESEPGSAGSAGDLRIGAGTLSVSGGGQISASTQGAGKGGDVGIAAVSDIVLSGPGPQITAMSTGSGDAGSVSVSAFRLMLSNGAAISTEAETSTASGGNITLKAGDFLYLKNGEITTSVKGETGNGGNITIDPQYVVLDQSSIIAQAIEGHGGNITINANEYLQSADSVVSATSALGISGTIEIIGPRVDLNGALVVLSSELRSAAQVLRNSCAAQAGLPQSSLVEGGRGGLPQDPDATLPALYIAGRDMSPPSTTVPGPPPPIPAQQTTARLTMRCG
jgi:filamentous hemagglutinin family protein